MPEHFVQAGIGNYGYAGSADLLVPITAPKDLVPGSTAVLAGKASWLVCADICIPGAAKLSLNLPVAAGPVAPDPAAAELFARIRRQLPLPAAFEARFVADAREYRLQVPEGALTGLHDATGTFFPNDDMVIDHAAEIRATRCADGLEIVMPKAAAAAAVPPTLDGVLVCAVGVVPNARSRSAPTQLRRRLPRTPRKTASLGGRRCCSPFSAA